MGSLSTSYPTLRSLRVVEFSAINEDPRRGAPVLLAVQQNVNLRLAVPNVPQAPLMLSVRVELSATVADEQVNEHRQRTRLHGKYEGQFLYPSDVHQDAVTPLLEDAYYQYVVAAQAYPLAMSHFRRQLQATGLDARDLPLGLSSPDAPL